MNETYDLEWGRAREQSVINRDGTEATYIVVQFWIGKHGPFTERFTRDEWLDPIAKQQRVDKLRQSVMNLPK